MSEQRERKINALKLAIHACIKRLRDIREDDILTEEQKKRQIDAHESYLRTLFAMREEALFGNRTLTRSG
jgi:transposase